MARRLPVCLGMAVDPETMEEFLVGLQVDERPLRPAEVVEGTIASFSADEVLLDLGGRSAGGLGA